MTSKPATVEEIIALQNDRLNALEAEVQGVRTSLDTLAARKPEPGNAAIRKELADGLKRLRTALAGDLRGKPGRNGKDGKPGKDGKDGRDGTPGIDGKDGKDGPPGKDGADGQTPDITPLIEQVDAALARLADAEAAHATRLNAVIDDAEARLQRATTAVNLLISGKGNFQGNDRNDGQTPDITLLIEQVDAAVVRLANEEAAHNIRLSTAIADAEARLQRVITSVSLLLPSKGSET